MLLIKSSTFSVPKSFSLSIVWSIWWIFPLEVTIMFTSFFQNQVELLFLELFSRQYLLLIITIALHSIYSTWWKAYQKILIETVPTSQKIALHTLSFRTLSSVSRSIRLTFIDSLLWCWTLLTAFLSKWIIHWRRRVLQFFVR